jgi:GAF domain-containing protein
MSEPAASIPVASLHRDLADRFADLAGELGPAPDLASAFTVIAQHGLRTIDGAEHAGITVLRRGEFQTPAATSDVPRRVDAIQYELSSGPCVDAVLEDTVFRTGDLETDPRWPEFGRLAFERTGVRSMLAVRLYSDEPGVAAALNLYAAKRDAFADASVPVAIVLATHASLALTAAGRREQIVNLEQALAASREIGIAIGVLMTRHLVTQQQAFDLLRMASQRSHRKLREIATRVVETGDIDFL